MPKTLISIRLETSLLAWFKAHAADGGYQSKIGAVLKDFQNRSILREQRTIGRAQQIFLQYHARCFWHLRKDLQITKAHIPLIQNGLRKFGGLEGLRIAAALDPGQMVEPCDAAD